MAKILLSAFADEYSKEPEAHIAVLLENGVKFIEPRFVGDKNIADLTEDEAKAYKSQLDAAGISTSSVGSPLGKIKLDDDFDMHMERARRVFNIAGILETKNVRMFSFYPAEGKNIVDSRNEVIEKVGKMLDVADEFGLTLCHENEAKIYGETPERCLDLLKTFDGRLKCVFDMGNFVLDKCQPYPYAYDLLRDYIEYFHIKDSLYARAIVPAGKGEASVADILKAYKSYTKKDFYISLEPHLETFSGLHTLVQAKRFENPYKFNSPEEAFLAGLESLKELLATI